MGFLRMHLRLTGVAVILLIEMAAAAVAYQLAKPNCPDKCGEVEIPYPFGIGDGCYLSEDFSLSCNNSSGQDQLQVGTVIVKDITIKGQLDVLLYTASDCYNESSTVPRHLISHFQSSTTYTLSDAENMFMAVGCDTYAFLDGYQNNETYSIGCMSLCQDLSSVQNGSCSGIGCCQIKVPERLHNFTLEAKSYYNHTKVLNFNPCSYAFVVKQDAFNFSSGYLYSLQYNKTLPAVIDWAIGNARCNSSTTICGSNSECYDPYNSYGYRCECKAGYDGNPHLPDGCQDVNECTVISNPCNITTTCINLPGSFNCSCPKGYEGDGMRNGTGCSSTPKVSQSSDYVIKIALGITMSLLVLIVGASWVYLGFKRRQLIKLKEKFFQQNGGLILRQQLSSHRGSMETTKIFSAEELEKATNNYDESRVVGQGGFGTVYRGVLPDEKVVAIKKSKIVDKSQTEQFINEVIVLTQINHRNVVKLLGCCLETEVPLLVYEFISNGTLHSHIHDKSLSSLLSWEKRLKIAAETAGVLSYLHSEASMPIIHRDVKSTNILLDDSHTSKVSDFGASRLVPLDYTQLTTLVQGTLGYLDPEYFHTSQLTEKSDVYSFGVVMTELLTGKKVLCMDRPEADRNLAIYFVSVLKEDRLLQILDDHIVNEYNVEELKEVANLARRCLRERGEDRPTMKEVAMELQGLRISTRHPWGKVDLQKEETECLLSGPAHYFSIDVGSGCSSSVGTTVGFESAISNQSLKSLDGGR